MINPTAGYASATGAARTVTYAYDGVGNRTSVVDSAAGTTNYTANNLNQYETAGSTSYTYDTAGNLSHDATCQYLYDHEGHLTQAFKSAGGETISYTYDAQGRRIKRIVGSASTQYVYDGDNLIEKRNNLGTVTAKYIYEGGIDHPVQAIIGANTYYFQQDALGNMTALTDSSGNLVEQYSYDIYGKPTIKDGSGTVLTTAKTPFLSNSREYEAEAGFYHYRVRVYSPDLGRFLQVDPSLFNGGDFNLYRYCGNNPINLTDPFGLCDTWDGDIDLGDLDSWLNPSQNNGNSGNNSADPWNNNPTHSSTGRAGGGGPSGGWRFTGISVVFTVNASVPGTGVGGTFNASYNSQSGFSTDGGAGVGVGDGASLTVNANFAQGDPGIPSANFSVSGGDGLGGTASYSVSSSGQSFSIGGGVGVGGGASISGTYYAK